MFKSNFSYLNYESNSERGRDNNYHLFLKAPSIILGEYVSLKRHVSLSKK